MISAHSNQSRSSKNEVSVSRQTLVPFFLKYFLDNHKGFPSKNDNKALYWKIKKHIFLVDVSYVFTYILRSDRYLF